MHEDRVRALRDQLRAALDEITALGTGTTPQRMAALHHATATAREATGEMEQLSGTMVADRYWLDGQPMHKIGTELGVSHTTVRRKVESYTPERYWAMERTSEGFRMFQLAPDQVRGVGTGVRVVPASWDVDMDRVDAVELWEELGRRR